MALTVAELEAVVSVNDRQMTGGLQGVLGKISKFGGQAVKALGAAGVAGGALFAAGVAQAMTLEDARARMEAELGLTKDEAARYGDLAGRVYANNFGGSLEEVSGAITTVLSSIRGMRKASDAEVEGMTEKVLTFADVFEVDVSRAAQVVGGAVRSGMVRTATQGIDLLTATMQRVPKQVREDVLDATDEYGQFFAALGINGEEAFTLLARSASKGMFGIDKTGDALKEFTIRATDMSSASKAGYDAIGMSQADATRNILAGGEKAGRTFDKIIDGLLSIEDPAKQSQAALALFGTPLEDLGVKDMPKFLRSLDTGAKGLGDYQGATQRMADAMGGTASAKLTSFFRTVKQQTIGVLGGTVLPWVQKFSGEFVDYMTPIAKKAGPIIRDVTEDVADFAQKMATKAGPIIDQVAGVLSDLFKEGGKGRQIMSDVGSAVAETWLQIMDTVGPVIEAIRAFFGSDLGSAMLDGVIGAVMVVIDLIGGLLHVVQGLAQIITGVFTGDWSKAWEGIKNLTTGVVEVLGAILGGLWNTIRTGLSSAMAVARALVSKGWEGIRNLFSASIGRVVGWLASLPGKARDALGSLGGAIGGVFRSAMSSALGTVTGIGGTIVSWVSGIPGRILGLAGRFGSAGRKLLQGFIDGMKNAAGIISGIAGNVWNAVKGLLNGAIGKINSALNFKINLPGKDLHVNVGKIPMLATGGRATSATLAVIGEGREPESVLPDSVLRGLLERAHAAGAGGRDQGNGRPSLMRDVHFHKTSENATARDLVNELMLAVRVADFGGVYA